MVGRKRHEGSAKHGRKVERLKGGAAVRVERVAGWTVTPAGQVRTDLFLPLQETQTWGRTDVLRLSS